MSATDRSRCLFDLDALACGELHGPDEARARAHVAGCPRCRDAHAERAFELRLFARRARDAVDGRALPDVDALLLRAAREPRGFFERARPFAARSSVALAVSAFALLALVHARRQRGFEPTLRPAVRADVARATSIFGLASDAPAWSAGPLPVSAEECGDVSCVCTASSYALVACAEPASAPVSRVECSSTRDAAFFLASDVDAVCPADAI